MGKQGIPMTNEERLFICRMYKQGYRNINDFAKETGYCNTEITDVITKYLNGQIDGTGQIVARYVIVENGQIQERIRPIWFNEEIN